MQVLTVYVKDGFSFARDLSLKSLQILTCFSLSDLLRPEVVAAMTSTSCDLG